jgi:ABC-type Fe3+-hydroxamate transport system substrate-binding protein
MYTEALDSNGSRAAAAMRVVSLIPSATELVAALGAVDRLVGRSHECDWPNDAAHATVLTKPRIKSQDPAAIDREVSAALAQGESLYEFDEAALVALAPDLIITQDLCEVCSIDRRSVERVAAAIPSKPRVLCLNPQGFEDVVEDLARVGEALGLSERAMHVGVEWRGRMYAAQEHVNALDEPFPVLFLEWTDPAFCAGHWTVQLIERAGGSHPWNPTRAPVGMGEATGMQQGARRAAKSRRLGVDEILEAMPRAVVIAPCGFDLERSLACARAMWTDEATREWWLKLPAVRDGRVAVVDGNQMFNRPGPRLVDAFEFLVGWLQDQPGVIPRDFPWCALDSAGQLAPRSKPR